MAEYISREAVLEICDFHEHLGSYDGVRRVAEDVRYLPTADVVEVRHGVWKYKRHKMTGETPCCSVCGGFHTIETKYCPNCGAKMDEVEDD